jgi:hypothetical protein
MVHAPERTINRYYDPLTDEFLSIDPDVATTDQAYLFTNDDPLNAEDSLGLLETTMGSEGGVFEDFGAVPSVSGGADEEGGSNDPADGHSITVRHYTGNEARTSIENSGYLKAGTHVTLPEELGDSASAGDVEKHLEIEEGKGENYIDIEVPVANLGIPETGPYTSGGAWQRVLVHTTYLSGQEFVP